MKARDEELRRMFDRVMGAKERARAKRLELEEQLSFLGNEKENVRELEGSIADLDRSAVRLHQTLDEKDRLVREFGAELALDEGETSKLKSLTDGKRAVLKETRKVLNHQHRSLKISKKPYNKYRIT